MLKTKLILLICFISLSLCGQEIKRLNDANFQVTLSGKASVNQLKNIPLFQQSDAGLARLKYDEDKQGNSHSRYQVVLQGVPVKGIQVTGHYSVRSQETVFIIPRGLPQKNNLALSTREISYDEALSIVKNTVDGDNYKKLEASPTNPREGLVIVPQEYDFKKPIWVEAYEIDVQTEIPWQSKRVTVDAHTGEVIFIENRLCTFNPSDTATPHCSGSHGTATTSSVCAQSSQTASTDSGVPGMAETYHHGTRPVETTLQNGVYVTHDQTRGTGIYTYDYYSGALFTDDDNYWDNANANLDEIAGDAHWGSAATFDFYMDEFGLNGLDGNGMGVISNVHLAISNAYWDGTATYYGDGSSYGDYDQPFAHINIISHEMRHGVTEFSSGLIYAGESGALNESISDIMGASMEYETFGEYDWLVGRQASSSGAYFRNMADPNDVSMAHTYLGQYWDSFYQAVHTNSSIGNFWFHLLVEGGSGTNDNNYDYTVDSLGWEKARLIAHTTWTNYLTPSSDYPTCAEFSIVATSILYGSCSDEVAQVRNAWAAVGVLSSGSEAAIQASPRIVCDLPTPVEFFATGEVTDHLWDFGDGNQSNAPNPTHIYQDVGTYTVSLSGVDCNNDAVSVIEEDFIIVDTLSTSCDTIYMNTNQMVNSCAGILVDDGGNNNYNNNVYTTVEITAPDARAYQLDFLEFSTESGYDYLYLYIDTGNGFEYYQTFNGVAEGTIIVEAARLQFIWSTDYSVTYPGFVIGWECITPSVPTAAFSTDNTVSCDGYVVLQDESLGYPDSWEWIVDGVSVASDQNPLIELPVVGTYDVELIACNDLGCDTLAKPDYVTYDDQLSFCDTIIMADDLEMTSYGCEGVLIDDGGIDGNYANNVYSVVDIEVPDAQAYQIDIQSFSGESCCDFLRVYADNGNGYELEYSFSGSPQTGPYIIESSKLRFLWDTDGSVTGSGFVIAWQCLLPSVPTAAFSTDNTISCDGYVALQDESLGYPDSWEWIVDGVSVASDQNPLIELPVVGTYDIELIACNDLGCDTLTKPDYVTYDDQLSFCDTIVMADDLEMTSYGCEGVLVDDGDTDGNYANNVYAVVDVEAPGALAYQVDIQEFYGESCCDYLRVYADTGNGYELEYSFYGSPQIGPYIIEGSKLRFLWDTDGSVTRPGFVVAWQCIGTDDAPLSSPTHEIASCSYDVTFNSNSYNADSVVWNFGDGSTDTGLSVVHTYQESGIYMVHMEASNANGIVIDSFEIETIFEVAMFEVPEQMLLDAPENITPSSHTIGEVWNIQWFLDGIYMSNSYNLSLELTELGTHTLTCIINDYNGCVSTHTEAIEAVLVIAVDDPEAFDEITIFPNPTKGKLNINNLSELDDLSEISLLNAVGQVVATASPAPGTDQISLDLHSLATGVYFVKIQTTNGRPFFSKVMKTD